MSNQVISAFQTTSAPAETEEFIKRKLKMEIESSLTEDHPVVKELVQKEILKKDMKLSKQREKHVEEVHSLEKKLQQAIHEKESAEKEFKSQK